MLVCYRVFLGASLSLSPPPPSFTPHACAQIKYLFTEEAKRQLQGKSVIQALQMTLLSKAKERESELGCLRMAVGEEARRGAVARYLRLVGDSFGRAGRQGAWRNGPGEETELPLGPETGQLLGQNARETGPVNLPAVTSGETLGQGGPSKRFTLRRRWGLSSPSDEAPPNAAGALELPPRRRKTRR